MAHGIAKGMANMRVAPMAASLQPDVPEQPQPEQPKDLGLAGLVLLAQFHDLATDAQQLAHQYGRNGELFDEQTLLLAAKHLGL